MLSLRATAFIRRAIAILGVVITIFRRKNDVDSVKNRRPRNAKPRKGVSP